jgi:hypothetical protein
MCVYALKCFYFIRFRLGQGYPYRSIFIDLDNKIEYSEIKKEIRRFEGNQ